MIRLRSPPSRPQADFHRLLPWYYLDSVVLRLPLSMVRVVAAFVLGSEYVTVPLDGPSATGPVNGLIRGVVRVPVGI
jgi:hypothetical protein